MADGSSRQVTYYRYQGARPSDRGLKLQRSVSTDFSPSEQIGQMMERLVAEQKEIGNTNVRFFMRPLLPAPPPAWDSQGTLLATSDARLVVEAVPADCCVVMVIPVRLGTIIRDIGVFVAPTDSVVLSKDLGGTCAQEMPGADWLQCGEFPFASLFPEQVAAVTMSVAGCAAIRCSETITTQSVVSSSACDHLIGLVDAAWSAAYASPSPDGGVQEHRGSNLDVAGGRVCAEGTTLLAASVRAGSREDDFKLMLTADELARIVGAAAYDSILAMLATLAPAVASGAPDAIALRRTVATGRWIGFHTDRAAATIQVPLRSDHGGSGGRLVFLWGNGCVTTTPRVAGALLGHPGDAVHGVTSLQAGRRYGLFVLRARAHDRGSSAESLLAKEPELMSAA